MTCFSFMEDYTFFKTKPKNKKAMKHKTSTSYAALISLNFSSAPGLLFMSG